MKLCLLIVGALAASHAFSTPESAAAMVAPAEKTFEALAFVPNATAIGLGFVESALTQAQAHLALQLGNLLSVNVTAFKDAWCEAVMPLMAFNLTTFTEAIKDHVRTKVAEFILDHSYCRPPGTEKWIAIADTDCSTTFLCDCKEAIDEDGDIELDEVKESISAAFLEAEPPALTDNNSPTVAEYGADGDDPRDTALVLPAWTLWVTVTVLPVALAVRVTRDSALRAWADPAAPAQMV